MFGRNKKQPTVPWKHQDPHSAYRFGQEVGRGQYGITSLVTENSSGTTYACKVISKHQRGFSLAYVRDEVLALQRVDDHLNVVSLHEVWETKDDVYIFMEACMGGELFDVIISRGHISECDAAAVASVILQVVAHCHERGVIHRDLKPENFLLKRRYRKGKLVLSEDNLRAVDFGLAAFLSPGKRFKDLVGSAFYVAPEVLRESYGKEADLWSCGVIIYILLCGLPPFYGPSEKAIFHAILNAPIDMSSDPWPHVSTPAKDLVNWLLQRDPAKRPTAKQALEHAWLSHPPQFDHHPPSSTIVQRLADFTRMTRLQGLLMHVVANHLSKAEVDSLHDLFDEMDKDGNGAISIDELREGLTTVMGSEADPDAAVNIMAALDVSGDGEIDYMEFLAAVCDHQRMLADHTLAGIFAHMDKDGNGRISASEVSTALGETGLSVTPRSLEGLIAQDLQLPGCKSLGFDEFKALMMGGLKDEAVQYKHLESALKHMRQSELVSSRFKRLVLLVIARAMPASEQVGLKRLFEKLDADASGFLSLAELRAGLHHINKQLNEQDLFELMHFMDVDASGQIDFDEFCMGIMDEKVLLSVDRLHLAFQFFDRNKDGHIDLGELQDVLKEMTPDTVNNAADILRDAAGNAADKGVDFEAFERMMRNVDASPSPPAGREPESSAEAVSVSPRQAGAAAVRPADGVHHKPSRLNDRQRQGDLPNGVTSHHIPPRKQSSDASSASSSLTDPLDGGIAAAPVHSYRFKRLLWEARGRFPVIRRALCFADLPVISRSVMNQRDGGSLAISAPADADSPANLRQRAAGSILDLNMPQDPTNALGAFVSQPSEIQVFEVAAFSSVHDMIHAAISSHGPSASLREIYRACELRGRIAYKRSGGSRLITHNDHWKSQIRHALYTCDRFIRVAEGADAWMVSRKYAHTGPQTTKVLVRADGVGGGEQSVDTAPLCDPHPHPSSSMFTAKSARTKKPAKPRAPAKRAGNASMSAVAVAASAGVLPPASPRRKRSVATRAPAQRRSIHLLNDETEVSDSDDAWEGEDDSKRGAASNGQDAESCLPEQEGMAEVASNGVAYQRAQRTPLHMRAAEMHTAASAYQGGDAGSQNDHPRSHAPRLWMRNDRQLAARPKLGPRRMHTPPPAMFLNQPQTPGSSGCTHSADGMCAEGMSKGGGTSRAAGPLLAGHQEYKPQQDQPPLRHIRTAPSATMEDAWTGEAESPPAHKSYDLRPRASSTPQSTPGFGKDATPEAAAAAERAASITQGPIKKRLKAAVKAAAEVEAAREAAMAASTQETTSEHTDSPCAHHFSPLDLPTSAEPSFTPWNLLRTRGGACMPAYPRARAGPAPQHIMSALQAASSAVQPSVVTPSRLATSTHVEAFQALKQSRVRRHW
ncbi:hypothetical protein WJX73_009571 [Symbiochloris irregularis]|uniref:Calmodulin n=1 Tax=Symbiochloris irregularis TaxID=706552 RepID=A0AAW1NVT6_9CHLO